MAKPKGAPKTGGRKKGVPNKATVERAKGHAELVEQARREGETPLACMLRLMRDPEQSPEVQRQMAIAAAPYCHPRLNSVDHRGEMNVNYTATDEASEEVARRLARIAAANGAEEGSRRH
jgi:hypothetical protein